MKETATEKESSMSRKQRMIMKTGAAMAVMVGLAISAQANLCMLVEGHTVGGSMPQVRVLSYEQIPIEGIGLEENVMRRDPSDIIKVGDAYYVWYTKATTPPHRGYDATIWYARSEDGKAWTEIGEALARGGQGSWSEQSVFTPNILVAKGRYWLFFTGVPKPFINHGPNITKTAIGVAVSDSPDGPWQRVGDDPILLASDDPQDFDSMRVDDACLIVRNGRYYLYFKGRQWDNTPGNTKMGVAIAERPQGPYIKHEKNPIVEGGHEVLVWPYGEGVVALISTVGAGVARTLQYSDDGINFAKMADMHRVPSAPGAYRPEAFTDSGRGEMIEWGLHIGRLSGHPAGDYSRYVPFLERFEFRWDIEP